MKKILQHISESERAVHRFLSGLVGIRTSNPPGLDYLECCEYLRDEFKALGVDARIHKVPAANVERVLGKGSEHPRYIVVVDWNVGAKRTLHFNGHYDVVPAEDWRSNPYKLHVADDWMYGRGTGDMKGGISAVWGAIRSLKASGREPVVNVQASFVPDEETGGALGAGYLMEARLVKPDFVVVCEGGRQLWLGCGHNGALWFDIEVVGKAAHTMYTEKGINALVGLAEMVNELKRLELDLAKRKFLTPAGTTMVPKMNIGGMFSGSGEPKVNTVPARARFSIDRRILPGEKLTAPEREIRACIQAALRKQKGLKASVAQLLRVTPCLTPMDSDVARAFTNAITRTRRSAPKFWVTGAFTDMRYFAERGIPAVQYGAWGQQIHAIDERLNRRDLLQTIAIYARVMCEWSS